MWPLLGVMGVSMPHVTVISAMFSAALWSTMPPQLTDAWRPMVIGHVAIAIAAWFVPAFHFEIYGLATIPIFMTVRRMSALKPEKVSGE